jgi:hypothetical protein
VNKKAPKNSFTCVIGGKYKNKIEQSFSPIGWAINEFDICLTIFLMTA